MIQFIDDNDELYRLLEESMDKYNSYYWAVAWVGEPTLLEKLKQNKQKIKLIVTGLYGTEGLKHITSHSFVKEFAHLYDDGYRHRVMFLKKRCKHKHERAHFILHSKLYYFENSDSEWRLFVGSANFSKKALSSVNGNIEAVVVCDQDSFSNEGVKQFFELLQSSCHDNSFSFRPYNNTEIGKYLRRNNDEGTE